MVKSKPESPVEARHSLARAALRLRLKPRNETSESAATPLFELEDRIRLWEKSLLLLEATFEATDPETLSESDRATYNHEVRRRRRRLDAARRRSDGMLENYARELVEWPIAHPELSTHYAEVLLVPPAE